MTIPSASSLQWKLLTRSAPATPYSVVAFIRFAQFPNNNSSTSGLYFYSASSGKLIGLETITQLNIQNVRVERITSVTADNSTVYAQSGGGAFCYGGAWARITNDGSSLYFDLSYDGINWTNLYSESVGTYITPDHVGWGGIDAVVSGSAILINLLSWTGP